MTPLSRTPARPAVFVQQLHRAAAQRGRLDPVYQDLSDHWTMVLQRLYPVWALIGPGLSDPGHIEIHSRTVYLDSETLLGSRESIAAGRLKQRAILRCFGVALHETLHAKHTKRWAIEHDIELCESDDPADRQLAVDRRLLEEPRMEAHGVREFPRDSLRGRFVRRALQAAVTDVILPAFAEQIPSAAIAGLPVTRDLAARASVYLQARIHYGIVESATLDPLRVVWRAVLGGDDLRALDDLYAKVIWIPDGELDRLDEAACAYRQIVGEPDPRTSAGGTGEPAGSGEGGGEGEGNSAEGDCTDCGGAPPAGSLADALEQAIATARDAQLEQLDEDVDLQQVLANATAGNERASELGHGRGTGLPTGRLPDRGVDRPPFPDEVQHARRYANRLRQAIIAGTRQIDKRTPGGRFDGRAYARGRAEQAAGRPVTTHPWRVTRQVAAPIREPHVGLVIDTSGSMGGYEYALGPIAWILTDGLRQIGGRCATALFGNSAALLADGSRPLPLVPGIRTGGGTASAGDAIELVSDQLEMTNPRRPRFVYVLSDGGWSDTRAGVERIRHLAELGVPTIHLSIGIAPLSVECERITVITDPAQALDQIAADTVAALAARHRRPRGGCPNPHPKGSNLMQTPNRALQPCPALFDVTTVATAPVEGRIDRIELSALELAPNARREISREGIERLAGMLMRTGQLVPCIGHRPDPSQPRTVIYDGQRRLLAAQASAELAGTEGYEDLTPVQSLIVLLLDHEPGADEIRRIQAQANQRESLSLVDQQEQLLDCWDARAGLPEPDRVAAVCADLGISAKRAHNLRRQLALPDPIRARVAERPTGEQISVTMANRLADMHEIAPQLTDAVAKRITSTDLHDKALQDLGAFVHRTVVEDEHAYAVRIDDGAMLDAAEQIAHAREHLVTEAQRQIANILGCPIERLDAELDTLAARAKARALKLRITGDVRDRARNGRYAYVHDRGQDFAAGIWVVDPAFILDLVHEHIGEGDTTPAREDAYFAGARVDDEELRVAAAEDEQRRAQARARHADATRSNLGLGHDIRAGLIDPSEAQLRALNQIVCRLLVRHYRELIAYGAGWTDPERQQPVGDAGRHEPRQVDAIVEAELDRALADPDPLRGVAQLTARWAAAFVLDAAGVTRTKALGTETMARKLRDALPSGEAALRAAVWELMRPMLSPSLVALNRDAFVIDHGVETTVDLHGHRAPSDLRELNLDDDSEVDAR